MKSKQREIIWCPYREERVFVQICKKRCPKSRRRSCAAYLDTVQMSFDFDRQGSGEDKKSKKTDP